MERTNIHEQKFAIYVDSCNFLKTFGVARNPDTIARDAQILELPNANTLQAETGESSVIAFPFGRYILLCSFSIDAITGIYFFDYAEAINKQQLSLLLKISIPENVLEQFQNYHYEMTVGFMPKDDIAHLVLANES